MMILYVKYAWKDKIKEYIVNVIIQYVNNVVKNYMTKDVVFNVQYVKKMIGMKYYLNM